MRDRVLAATSLLGLWGAAAPALAGSYVYTQLQVPGSYYTGVTGINESGQVVGIFESFTGGQHQGGFTWQGGTYQTVEIGAALSFNAINGAGNVAGSHQVNGDQTQGIGLIYRASDGVVRYPLRDRPGFAGKNTRLFGINDSNTVVGVAFDQSYHYRGFEFRDGKLDYVTVPGSTDTALIGINNDGLGYGYSYYEKSFSYKYFRYQSGIVTSAPELDDSQVVSIDSAGRLTGFRYNAAIGGSEAVVDDAGTLDTFRWSGVVKGKTVVADYTFGVASTDVGVFGTYRFKNGSQQTKSFVKRGDTFYPLRFPGSGITSVTAVNRSGDFGGYYYPAPGTGPHVNHAFVAICPADQRPCTE